MICHNYNVLHDIAPACVHLSGLSATRAHDLLGRSRDATNAISVNYCMTIIAIYC